MADISTALKQRTFLMRFDRGYHYRVLSPGGKAAMQLTRDQARKLAAQLQPKLNYLFRLKRRLIEMGFVADDPFLQLADKACEAQQQLYIHAHYLAGGHTVGGAGARVPE